MLHPSYRLGFCNILPFVFFLWLAVIGLKLRSVWLYKSKSFGESNHIYISNRRWVGEGRYNDNVIWWHNTLQLDPCSSCRFALSTVPRVPLYCRNFSLNCVQWRILWCAMDIQYLIHTVQDKIILEACTQEPTPLILRYVKLRNGQAWSG